MQHGPSPARRRPTRPLQRACGIAGLVALVAVAACATSSTGSPTPRRRAAGVPDEGGAPGAAARAARDRVADNDACEGCHAEVAESWRASLHHASWTEPAFQRAFAREPLPFCQGCHAPEADRRLPPSPRLGALGTGCITCHVVDGEILGAGVSPRPVDHGAPHPVRRDGRLDGDAACARCHEFAFPEGGRPMGPEVPMQSTVSEHRASPAAAQSCASCHMPTAHGRRSHRFAASRDEDLLRAAVTVDAQRTSPTVATITLTSNVRGHAFPTGDLFRRLEVLVEAVGPGEVLLARQTRYLRRRFPKVARTPGGPRHPSVGVDDRLTHAPRTLQLELGAAAQAQALRFRVAYQRVAHPRSENAEESVLDGEVVLAEGVLPPTLGASWNE